MIATDAAGINMDVIPSVRLEEEWQSNVFDTSTDEVSSFGTRLTPRLALRFTSADNVMLQVSGNYEKVWYHDAEARDAGTNTWFFRIDSTGGWKLTPTFSVLPSVYFVNTNNSYRRTRLVPSGDPVVPPVTIANYGNTKSQEFGGGMGFDYRATPTAGLVFVRPSPRRPAGHREAWTQGEEEDTHYWLPSIDRLDDFGTTEAIVTVPRGLSVLANGRLVAQEEVGAATRWRWRQDQPHATYLTFIAAGPYEVAHHTWRQLPVAFWYLPWQRRQAPGSLAPTFAALDCFADTLGRTYPWEKYDQIAVSDYPFGGMENTTATPWR